MSLDTAVFRYFFFIISYIALQSKFQGLASRDKLLLSEPFTAWEDKVTIRITSKHLCRVSICKLIT